MANRWLLLNVDCLGALGVLITTFLAIPTPKEGAAWAAVSITSSMAFTMSSEFLTAPHPSSTWWLILA